ncbi:MAG: hypothetical protein PHC28_15610 [Flavobacterium sp.]|nr:hypothetical protein [Flavobacterium sp.]
MIDFDHDSIHGSKVDQNITDELTYKLLEYKLQCISCLGDLKRKLFIDFVHHQEENMPWKMQEAKNLYFEISSILDEIPRI